MKVINFGSLNIDKTYKVQEFVNPGQTIFASSFQTFAGGKGLNQSIAIARAGGKVVHAGALGEDGGFLLDLLKNSGADTSKVQILDAPSGHAIIEVNASGQNRIIVYGGTNQMLTEEYIDSVLECSLPGDIVLLQNETNLIGSIIAKAHEKGQKVAFNPSPMPSDLDSLPLDLVDYFIVNEIEAAQLAGVAQSDAYEETLSALTQKYPHAAVLMTLGSNGVLFEENHKRCSHPIFHVDAVDTTAAGDTFCGYFLSALCRGADIDVALKESSAASAIAVSRPGAAPSIPSYQEVLDFLASR